MTLPSVAELQARYATACDLKQIVDREKIAVALRAWAAQIGAPGETGISFVGSSKDIARDARDAWAARAASFEVGWLAITAIGAVSVGDEAQAKIWLPVLEAFEAGAFAFWVTDAEIFVSTIPAKVMVDEQRRLHCADGPAFVWLGDIADCYWRGTYIPAEWITRPKTLTAKVALATQNIEQRRAACEILGWSKILADLNAKTIDADDDPQIGELVEVTLPDLPNAAKFLRVRCGTGREFAIGIPPHINSALDAQAWCVGLEPKDFIQPEVRA